MELPENMAIPSVQPTTRTLSREFACSDLIMLTKDCARSQNVLTAGARSDVNALPDSTTMQTSNEACCSLPGCLMREIPRLVRKNGR